MAAKQKYDERFVKIAKVLCMRGGTDEDLADAFEVSPRTINRWKKDYPEFAEALAAGKEYADDNGDSHTAGVYAGTEHSLYEGYVWCFFIPGGNQTG